MPSPGETGHGYRVRGATVLRREADNVLTMQDRVGASLVVPTSGTFQLLDAGGNVVASPAVTIVSSIATVTVLAASLPSTLAFGGGYREVWTLTYSTGVQVATRPAYVSKYPLQCPVTQADIEDEYPDIGGMMNTSTGNVQNFIDSAWNEILRQLTAKGEWPDAYVDVQSLFTLVREFALEKITAFMALSGTSTTDRSERHRANAAAAWGQVRTRRDLGQSGVADSPDMHAANKAINTRAAPAYRYRRFGTGYGGVR